MHRTRKKPRRGRKKRDAPDAEVPRTPSSSLEESDKSGDPKDSKMPEQDEPATEEESAPAGATASAAAAGHETDEAEHSAQTGRSKPPSSAGSKRERASHASKGSRASQKSRGTHKADTERDNRRMMEMLGSLEHGHLKPKPIFPQAILGHLFMRKFGLNREQRAHIIRSTNGSSRLEDVERIVRASDLEEFRSDDRRREDRKPI